jgi:general stress protein 26
MEPPRSTHERKVDVLEKLAMVPGTEKDVWVASASASGEAYLIPLTFYWDGMRLTISTPKRSRTARNLQRAGVARMALSSTRDVVIIEGTLEFIGIDEDDELAAAHTEAAGFNARSERPEYVYIRMTPQKIRAWGGENELAGGTVMVDGQWLTG